MGVLSPLKSRKFLGFGALFMIFLFLLSEPKSPKIVIQGKENLLIIRQKALEERDIQKWMSLRMTSTTPFSKLGEILFLNASEPDEENMNVPNNNERFLILVWKYGKTIENRHLKHFSGNMIDPFEHCPVKNCNITYSDQDFNTADIVIFHLHRIKGIKELPVRQSKDQIWTFLTDESPYNTFLERKNNKLSDYNGLFNWSMTYRKGRKLWSMTTAEGYTKNLIYERTTTYEVLSEHRGYETFGLPFSFPYGRTVLITNPEPSVEIQMEKRRDVLVAIMGSNCGGINHRWEYVKELQKHMQVDVYGGCGPFKNCPGHFKADCPALDQYLFYLSFENSNCNEYITEKLWWNAYRKNSIPIVMGSNRETYKKLLPPGSYINIEDFASPAALAQNLLRLNQTGDFKKYYRWKANFDVLNEHGYFQSKSYHYCRVCQALNYNTREPQVYHELEEYWNIDQDCHPAWDTWED